MSSTYDYYDRLVLVFELFTRLKKSKTEIESTKNDVVRDFTDYEDGGAPAAGARRGVLVVQNGGGLDVVLEQWGSVVRVRLRRSGHYY